MVVFYLKRERFKISHYCFVVLEEKIKSSTLTFYILLHKKSASFVQGKIVRLSLNNNNNIHYVFSGYIQSLLSLRLRKKQ